MLDQLIQSLNSDDDSVRIPAAEALGKTGDPRAREALRARGGEDISSDDPDFNFFLTVAIALTDLGYYRALANIISSDAEWVRPRTLTALRRFGKHRVVDALIKALEGGDNGVRFWVADALGGLGDKRAVEPLIRSLKGDDFFARAKSAESLGKLKDARALPALQQMQEQDTYEVCRSTAGESIKLIQQAKPPQQEV